MSVFNCNASCVGELVPKRYDQAACVDVLRTYGFDGLLFFHCTVSFTDIQDTTEWDTYLAAGSIIKSPVGNYSEGDSNDEVAGEDGCGNQIIDFSEVPFSFETFQTSENRSDETWFHKLDQKWNQYTMGLYSCDGYLYLGDAATNSILDDAAVAIASPIGYQQVKTRRPKFIEGNGKGKAGRWFMEGFYRTRQVQRGILIPNLSASLAAV